MSDNQTGMSSLLSSIFVALLLLVGLGESYEYVIRHLHVKPWIGVLIAHLVLALLVFLIRKPARVGFKLKGTPLMAWLAGPLVLIGAFVLALSSPKSDVTPYSFSGSSEIFYVLATLTVIPLAEEMVFRMGMTPFLSRFAGNRWGPWYSAVVFSVAHTHPTWGRLTGLKLGLPIGPFILAICCDIIVRRWGRVWPAAAFHSACNATVYIFAWLSPSWLSKLGGLYM
jgi:membrane protease YdiL (CAAX protease family)